MRDFQKVDDQQGDSGFDGIHDEPVVEGDQGFDDKLDLPSRGFKRQRIMEGLPEVEVDLARAESVTSTALSNVVIIKAILKGLSVPDLLRVRLVNLAWKDVANTVLKCRAKPPAIAIDEKTDFDELMCTIWKCGEEHFPFRGLKIHMRSSDFGNKPERWTRLAFLRMFGHLFTHRKLYLDWSLMIQDDDDGEDDRNLANVLSGLMSNFKKIKVLCGRGYFGNSQLTLDATRVLKFSSSPGYLDREWVTHLIQACPNLEKISGLHFASMPGVFVAGKSELVVDMIYCECYPVSELNENRAGLRLTKLRSLQICPSETCEVLDFGPLRDILEASAGTLSSLEICCELKSSSVRRWPELRNLEELIVRAKNCFPRQFSDVFTSLAKVVLHTLPFSSGSTVLDFLWDDAVPSVDFLEIHCEVTTTDISYLATIFPNVNCIFVHCSGLDPEESGRTYQSLLWDVWSLKEFQELRRLAIMNISVKRMAEANFSLDAFVTGYPQFLINKLRAQPGLLSGPYVDLMREATASVTSLKRLQALTFIFDDVPELTPEDFPNERPFASDILFHGGLNAKPGLTTHIFYNFSRDHLKVMERLLLPVSHRIIIKHRS